MMLGVAGAVREPLMGLNLGGFSGMATGFFTGWVGLVLRPTYGALMSTSQVCVREREGGGEREKGKGSGGGERARERVSEACVCVCFFFLVGVEVLIHHAWVFCVVSCVRC